MDFIPVLLVAAATFGVCVLADKGFTKLFRSKPQHASGKAIRLNKRYGSIGAVMIALGVAAIFSGIANGWFLIAGGSLITVVGIGLVVYYLSYGIYYDADSFLYTTFAHRSVTYRYNQIRAQQLYNASGNLIIELHMTDSTTVPLQASMVGVYDFLDTAFAGWCAQTGKRAEDCAFHDPDNNCYFPRVEE